MGKPLEKLEKEVQSRAQRIAQDFTKTVSNVA
jgi:hypothetical protein